MCGEIFGITVVLVWIPVLIFTFVIVWCGVIFFVGVRVVGSVGMCISFTRRCRSGFWLRLACRVGG